MCFIPSQSNIILIDKIKDDGLAICFPAISKAAPCTGSNNAKLSPIFAAGATPSPPTTCAASSESISPNKFVVTITSNSWGCRIRFIAQASTYMCSKVIPEFLRTSFSHVLANKPSVLRITFDL